MSSRVGENVAVALAQRRADLIRGSRLVEQVRVRPDGDVGVGVAKLRCDVDRVELQPDDQQRRAG